MVKNNLAQSAVSFTVCAAQSGRKTGARRILSGAPNSTIGSRLEF
jgi:hypothetical protein